MTGKADLEFASEEWVQQANEALKTLVHETGDSLAGQELSICQVLTGAPPHLRPACGPELAWSLVIRAGEGAVQSIELERATLKTRADYETIRRSARTADEASIGGAIERARIRQEAIEGRIVATGSLDEQSAEMMQLLGALHSRTAPRTACSPLGRRAR